MVFRTGTASNYADLYSKLIAFLTTDADLRSNGQAWTKRWVAPSGEQDGVVLAGPGLAGLDAVLVGLDLTGDKAEDQSANRYWMTLSGMSGVLARATDVREHVNVLPFRTRIFLDPNPMQYWFIANGRRFIVVVKISTVFESAYAGLFLPYATPVQYPYPLAIGGSSGGKAHTDTDSWRSREDTHSAFPFSSSDSGDVMSASFGASFAFLSPAGEWVAVRGKAHGTTLGATLHPNASASNLYAYATQYSEYSSISYRFAPQDIYKAMGPFLGTSDLYLQDFTIVRNAPNEAVLGVLDGCYKLTGDGNSSENLVTVAGVDHLTVQNAYRTTLYDYFAVALE